ncbi:histidine phosphatase family protein [Leptolinea tardivitalis]|uniref:histidine phosphatase family protein n=1 Tax=Leptolinea tardivitalis TaxID=229920 RepID=UPI0007853EBE|nr:histidine phosphatase family protein [Leptolinea tardivitalis]GAP20385.1 fructose-2,6-bisphosphatase [Leptolinea tardivitalis]
MTEIWLVRHGQTDWNLEGRLQGQLDVPLNETGLKQAQSLAETLRGKPFSAIYSSDLMRARQTAEIIARVVNLPITFDKRLREISQGQVEGMLFSDVIQKFEGALADRTRNPVESRLPGGESVAELAERFRDCVDEISRQKYTRPVLLIAHGLAIATILCQARGYPMETVYSHIQENATAEVIEWNPPA